MFLLTHSLVLTIDSVSEFAEETLRDTWDRRMKQGITFELLLATEFPPFLTKKRKGNLLLMNFVKEKKWFENLAKCYFTGLHLSGMFWIKTIKSENVAAGYFSSFQASYEGRVEWDNLELSSWHPGS